MQVSVSFDPTSKKDISMALHILHSSGESTGKTIESSDKPETTELNSKAKPSKKKQPEKTVSPDEDEDFGTKAIEEEELEEEEESDEEEETLSFDTVKAAINEYGGKNSDAMKAILLSFNMKSTKELSQHPKKWAPVLDKVLAKLSAGKKRK